MYSLALRRSNPRDGYPNGEHLCSTGRSETGGLKEAATNADADPPTRGQRTMYAPPTTDEFKIE